MNNRHNAVQLIDIICVLAIAMALTVLFIEQTVFKAYETPSQAFLFKLIRYGAYGVALVKVIITPKYSKRFLLIAIVLSAIIAISAIRSNYTTFLVMIPFMIALYGINETTVLKIYAIIQGLGLTITILCSQFGIIENTVFDDLRSRMGLGFNWTTLAPIFYMFFVFAYVYLRKKHVHLIGYLILLLINIWLYIQTNTRLAFLITTVYLVYCFVEEFIIHNQYILIKHLRILLCLMPIIICVVCIAITILYDPSSSSWLRLDKALSGRLNYGSQALDTYPITLFGQKIQWIGQSLTERLSGKLQNYRYNNVDCSYIRIMLQNGVLVLATCLFLYTRGIYQSIKKRNYDLAIIFILVLLFSATEQWLMIMVFNPFVLVSVCVISDGDRIKTVSNRLYFGRYRRHNASSPAVVSMGNESLESQ